MDESIIIVCLNCYHIIMILIPLTRSVSVIPTFNIYETTVMVKITNCSSRVLGSNGCIVKISKGVSCQLISMKMINKRLTMVLTRADYLP